MPESGDSGRSLGAIVGRSVWRVNKPAAGSALAAPVYLAPAKAGQQATILVLNPAPTGIANPHPSLDSLHLAINFIARARRMLAGEFRFASVFADLPEPPAALPAADLVFNNIASGELPGQAGRLEKATALAGRAGSTRPRRCSG